MQRPANYHKSHLSLSVCDGNPEPSLPIGNGISLGNLRSEQWCVSEFAEQRNHACSPKQGVNIVVGVSPRFAHLWDSNGHGSVSRAVHVAAVFERMSFTEQPAIYFYLGTLFVSLLLKRGAEICRKEGVYEQVVGI
jgi:hypothetical protein